MTIRNNAIANASSRGFRTIKETSKYVVMERNNDSDHRLFIGKRGAIRIGRTVADSVPVAPVGYNALAAARR